MIDVITGWLRVTGNGRAVFVALEAYLLSAFADSLIDVEEHVLIILSDTLRPGGAAVVSPTMAGRLE